MDAVAPTAMTVGPENWMNGIADSAPMITHVATGVCNRGLTLAIVLENGSWSSRAIPNAKRMVEVRIDMQHTKIAATKTTRQITVKVLERKEPRVGGVTK